MPVTITHATGRGVAERWRSQYQADDGKWTRTAYGDSERIYERLCDLGSTPTPDAVASAIGNESWSHILCSCCNKHVLKAVEFDNYGRDIFICMDCVAEMARVSEVNNANQ